MKALIVYKSKTGFTKRYAQWIQESSKFDIQSYDDLTIASLSEYDFIIFGSRVHAGRIDGLKKIKAFVAGHPKIRLAFVQPAVHPMRRRMSSARFGMRVLHKTNCPPFRIFICRQAYATKA